MGRGTPDDGPGLSTLELLAALHQHGPHAADATGYDPEQLAAAVGREFKAGNLLDPFTLSMRGRQTLERLIGAAVDGGDLHRALDDRATIHRAQGYVAETERIPLDDALDRLRRETEASGRSLADVARDVAASSGERSRRAFSRLREAYDRTDDPQD